MKSLCLPVLIISTTINAQTTGTIERYDSSINTIISPSAKIEIIATGFEWSEGPLWVEKNRMLLFSDVPRNTVYKWTKEKGTEVYLTPSGYTDSTHRGGETGSNGLVLDAKGRLVLCQHGDRRMARMEAPLNKPAPKFITLASRYNGKKFNSPNDAVYNSHGELFFTDPPFGLEQRMNDPKKELSFQGVYQLKTNGEVVLITDTITRPNGLAFFPGEKTLLVANSDGQKQNWYAYDRDANGKYMNGRIFYSANAYDPKLKGGPDGLKIDKKGNVFATGPGGIWIFNSKAKLLGKILLTEAASNCALSADEKTLFITNDMNVVRVILR